MLCCVVLFRFVLFRFVLFCFVLFYFVLFWFVLVWFCFGFGFALFLSCLTGPVAHIDRFFGTFAVAAGA